MKTCCDNWGLGVEVIEKAEVEIEIEMRIEIVEKIEIMTEIKETEVVIEA